MQWWQNLQSRERLIVTLAAIILAYILLDTLFMQPLMEQRQQLGQKLAQAQDDLQWMRQAAQRLPRLNRNARPVLAGRVITFLDHQISSHGLKKSMQQMAPIGDNAARIRLSDVAFNRLLNFFNAVSGALVVEEVRILPTDKPGLVNVSMTLSNGTVKK